MLGAGQAEAAAEAFGTIVEESPDDPLSAEASFARGRALQELGRPDEAMASFSWVEEHHADSEFATKAALSRARLLVENARASEAVPIFESLIEQAGPDSEEPVDLLLAELGWARLDAGNPDEADQAFQRLLDEFPDSSHSGDARLNLAESAFKAGRSDEVIDLLGPLVD